MLAFGLGVLFGVVVATVVAIWLFIAWAIGAAEKSIRDDMEHHENDNL